MARRNYLKTDSAARAAWRRKAVLAAAIVGGLYVLLTMIVGEMGVVKYYRMRTQYRALQAETEHLMQDNQRLAREVAALRSDPAYIERLARDTIGLARPGEVVYYYGDPLR